MFKNFSGVLFLYMILFSIFNIRAQDNNNLIKLNNKPFPIFLSSLKNETHYFILTSGESLCIEIKTGNIVRIPNSNTYENFCFFYLDLSNSAYKYCGLDKFHRIDCCPPEFIHGNIFPNGQPILIGSMKDSNDIILYGYLYTSIYFFYKEKGKTPNVSVSLKSLRSCKILINTSRYICIGNEDNRNNLILYIIKYLNDNYLYKEKYNSSLFAGYLDGYLYDTLDLNNKILCAKKIDGIEVNCWLCNVSLSDLSYTFTELSEISFETYVYKEKNCYLEIINSTFLFCCGGINRLACFEIDTNFNLINKTDLNIYGNVSNVTIINHENNISIIFMNTIDKNNYTSYMYNLNDFLFEEENIISSDNKPTSSYSNSDNTEIIITTQIEETFDNIDYLKINYYKTNVNEGIDYELINNKILYTLTNIHNQKNNLNINKTTVDLEECGNILKKQVYTEIPENADLYIIKIDINEEGMKIPKIEYALYYPLYGQDLIELNMSKCEGINVDISIPVNLTDDIDKYNTSSDYYNDICSNAKSKSGTDITLNDRKNEFINNNMTLCEEDCNLIEYNEIIKKVKCNC